LWSAGCGACPLHVLSVCFFLKQVWVFVRVLVSRTLRLCNRNFIPISPETCLVCTCMGPCNGLSLVQTQQAFHVAFARSCCGWRLFPSETDFVKNSLSIKSNFVAVVKAPLRGETHVPRDLSCSLLRGTTRWPFFHLKSTSCSCRMFHFCSKSVMAHSSLFCCLSVSV
jgi:hypothetical protein